MQFEVSKILAVGSNKRFMWIHHNTRDYCVRISLDLYNYLRSLGVPTSQSLKKKG